MITKSLRIKRCYLHAIRNGEKSREYRADKACYEWLGEIDTPFKLRLHYQNVNDQLVVVVTKVKRIATPAWIPSEFIDTKKCWELSLEN